MINKQWKASSVLMVVCIFFVALNMRPAVTAIGPLYNVLLESLHISNTKMSFLTSIPVFCMGLFAPVAVPLQKKIGHENSYYTLNCPSCLCKWIAFFKRKLWFTCSYKLSCRICDCAYWSNAKCLHQEEISESFHYSRRNLFIWNRNRRNTECSTNRNSLSSF